MSFFAKLEERVLNARSLLCIGLDPHKSLVDEEDLAETAYEFCIDIINKTAPFAAAFKPNSAFFERLGAKGLNALKRVIEVIPKDIPIILDCKRGDIDTTAQAYASASFEYLHADSVTVNPYMGWDSVNPFISGQYSAKGAWVLCKTSNKSSKDLQETLLGDNTMLYEKVVEMCLKNADSRTVGLVVGATDTTALTRVRALAPHMWILCPGVGFQGGDLKAACTAGFRLDGSGLLMSVSRAISSATDKADAARTLRDEINAVRAEIGREPVSAQPLMHAAAEEGFLLPYQQEFVKLSVESGALQFGSFKLKSGRVSPYFFNAGKFYSGTALRRLGRCYAAAILASGMQFDVLFGPAYKGIPLVATVAVALSELSGGRGDWDICYNRKEPKDHGEGGSLVGAAVKGRRVLIVDDVITAGTAIREAVGLLAEAGARLVGVSVCLDRQERAPDSNDKTGTMSAVKLVEVEFGIPVLAVATLQHLIEFLKKNALGSNNDLRNVAAEMEEYGVQYGAKN